MFQSDVFVDVEVVAATVKAERTLELWLLATLILEVSLKLGLRLVALIAFQTRIWTFWYFSPIWSQELKFWKNVKLHINILYNLAQHVLLCLDSEDKHFVYFTVLYYTIIITQRILNFKTRKWNHNKICLIYLLKV